MKRELEEAGRVREGADVDVAKAKEEVLQSRLAVQERETEICGLRRKVRELQGEVERVDGERKGMESMLFSVDEVLVSL